MQVWQAKQLYRAEASGVSGLVKAGSDAFALRPATPTFRGSVKSRRPMRWLVFPSFKLSLREFLQLRVLRAVASPCSTATEF